MIFNRRPKLEWKETFWDKLKRFLRSLFKKVPSVTAKEFTKDLQSWSKNDLIRAIYETAGRINGNVGCADRSFRKELRSHSKKHLIKTLTLLTIADTDATTRKIVRAC